MNGNRPKVFGPDPEHQPPEFSSTSNVGPRPSGPVRGVKHSRCILIAGGQCNGTWWHWKLMLSKWHSNPLLAGADSLIMGDYCSCLYPELVIVGPNKPGGLWADDGSCWAGYIKGSHYRNHRPSCRSVLTQVISQGRLPHWLSVVGHRPFQPKQLSQVRPKTAYCSS